MTPNSVSSEPGAGQGFVHCSCGDTVWRRGPLGHGHVWAIQGSAAAGGPAVAATGRPATILSAGSSACWTRRRSRPHSAVHAGFAKANGLELRGVVAVDGKALRGAFERGRQSTPLHMVNVWAAEARMCLAQRKAPRRNQAAGALEVPGLLDLEGCIVTADPCTAIATLPPRCSSGVRITCWPSINARIAIKLPQPGRTFPPSGNRDVIPKRYQIVEFAPSVLKANAKARARSVPTTFGQLDAG